MMYRGFITIVTLTGYTFLGLVLLGLSVYILYPAITYDAMYLYHMVRFMRRHKKWLREETTLADRVEEVARERGDKTFIYFEGREFSYSDINRQANRIMNYLLEAGEVRLRDPVCMLMVNEPLFVSTWLALGKCGAIASLLNTNIRGASLMHCIKVSESKVIICSNDTELLNALSEIKSDLGRAGIKVFVAGAGDGAMPEDVTDLTGLSLACSEHNNESARKGVDFKEDPLQYLFTSGTTGLPKAIKYKHSSAAAAAHIMCLNYLCPDDIFYVCLPLYHGSALNLGLISVMNTGASMVLKKKFSVREFWSDVRRYRVTIIQYIGETARYLVQAPRSDLGGVYPHGHIKVAIGNGLTADIWREFKQRFNIQIIRECYGASDGNYIAINMDGKEGAVGRITPLFKRLMDVAVLVECDTETAEPKRGPDGLCIECPTGKAGLLVTGVNEVLSPAEYVSNKEASETRLISGVQRKGDSFLNSGDMMLIDKDGYLYFKDRLGSTFRWKGENVATTEVEVALLRNSQVAAANVYGVKIEGKDGRAGMAALVLEEGVATLDGLAMYRHITDCLPNYACPKFVRITDSLEMTGTYKLRKINLVKDGFDPRSITDKEKTYSILDDVSYNDILSGVIRM